MEVGDGVCDLVGAFVTILDLEHPHEASELVMGVESGEHQGKSGIVKESLGLLTASHGDQRLLSFEDLHLLIVRKRVRHFHAEVVVVLMQLVASLHPENHLGNQLGLSTIDDELTSHVEVRFSLLEEWFNAAKHVLLLPAIIVVTVIPVPIVLIVAIVPPGVASAPPLVFLLVLLLVRLAEDFIPRILILIFLIIGVLIKPDVSAFLSVMSVLGDE